MPLEIYTGTPGTGGKRNIASPTATKIAEMVVRSKLASAELSQERKSVTIIPMPTLQLTCGGGGGGGGVTWWW